MQTYSCRNSGLQTEHVAVLSILLLTRDIPAKIASEKFVAKIGEKYLQYCVFFLYIAVFFISCYIFTSILR